MTGSFIAGGIVFPLVLLALSVGGGLLVRRLGAGWLPGVLVAPVGFALLIATCSFATYISWLAPAAGYIALGFAVIGFLLEARAGTLVRTRMEGVPWALLVGVAALLAVGGPTLLSGTPTWSGYSRIVDIGFQMDFSQYLANAGRAAVGSDSSYHANAEKLVGIGYPGGGQATLGAIAALIRTNLAWCYQLYHAFAAAMGAVAIYSLLGKVTDRHALRALGAFVAIQPNVLYAYALEGGIKELTTASMLVTVAAVLAERLPGEGPHRSVVPAAVAISASVGAFSFGVAPWLGLLLASLFIVTLVRPKRLRAIVGWALLTAGTILITLPGVISAATQLGGIASNAIGGTVDLGLGNLSAPVPDWSAAGVWLTADYRFPLAHVSATHGFDILLIVMALAGILFCLWRRRWVLAFLGLGAPIALDYYIAHSTAWLQFKSFTITGVFVLILAFTAAAALQRGNRRSLSLLGWLIAVVMAGAVLYGNATIYHDTTLAPAARYHDLAAIGHRYAGKGPALFPAFDEYAEYFLREAQGSSNVVPAHDDLELVPGVIPAGGVAFALNLNQFLLSYLQKFKLIVVPRGPTAIRAPSNWDLAEQTPYFDVWRRARPASDVYMHLPLSGSPTERTSKYCAVVQQDLRKAGQGASLAYVPAPAGAILQPASGSHSDYWKPDGGALIAYGAGSDDVPFTLSAGDRFDMWIEGTIGRPVKFLIDGHPVGTVAYEERYPGQFLRIGSAQIGPGRHTLRIVRGGGSLHPGSGDDVDPDTRILGAVVLLPNNSQSYQLHVVPAGDAARVCRARIGYEWMEILTRGAASATAAGRS